MKRFLLLYLITITILQVITVFIYAVPYISIPFGFDIPVLFLWSFPVINNLLALLICWIIAKRPRLIKLNKKALFIDFAILAGCAFFAFMMFALLSYDRRNHLDHLLLFTVASVVMGFFIILIKDSFRCVNESWSDSPDPEAWKKFLPVFYIANLFAVACILLICILFHRRHFISSYEIFIL